MSLSVKELLYEERLQRLSLSALLKRREREKLIAIYRTSKEMEKVDRDRYTIVRDLRNTRCQGKKVKRTCKKDKKVYRYSFPNISMEVWNNLNA